MADKNSTSVKVFIRIKPDSSLDETRTCCRALEDSRTVQIAGTRIHRFEFDKVFDKTENQEQVFQEVGKPLVEKVLSGYNATVFAYGQTGSGKTYTMTGPSSSLADTPSTESAMCGVIPRAIAHLFALVARYKVSRPTVKFALKVSFLEVYNERVFDLLDDSGRPLSLREASGCVAVEGLTEKPAESVEAALGVFGAGSLNRKVGATAMNRESSRSHSVFALVVESRETTNETGVVRVRKSQFNLVDLAGSERQGKAQTSGDSLREAAQINQSLSALGKVIKALADGTGKGGYVHYRDSKLTFLLKDSLGGNAFCVIVATVASDTNNFPESLSTLQFARRAKCIKLEVCVNEEDSGSLSALKEENKRLRSRVAALEQETQSDRASDGSSLFVAHPDFLRVDEQLFAFAELVCRQKEELVLVKKDLEQLRELAKTAKEQSRFDQLRLKLRNHLVRSLEKVLPKENAGHSPLDDYSNKHGITVAPATPSKTQPFTKEHLDRWGLQRRETQVLEKQLALAKPDLRLFLDYCALKKEVFMMQRSFEAAAVDLETGRKLRRSLEDIANELHNYKTREKELVQIGLAGILLRKHEKSTPVAALLGESFLKQLLLVDKKLARLAETRAALESFPDQLARFAEVCAFWRNGFLAFKRTVNASLYSGKTAAVLAEELRSTTVALDVQKEETEVLAENGRVLETELARTRDMLRTAEATNEELRKTIDDFHAQRDVLDELTAAKTELAHERLLAARLRGELAALSNEKEKVTEDKECLAKKLATVLPKLEAKINEEASLAAEVENLRTDHASVLEELVCCDNELEMQKEQTARLEKRLTKQNVTMQKLENANKELLAHNVRLVETGKVLESQNQRKTVFINRAHFALFDKLHSSRLETERVCAEKEKTGFLYKRTSELLTVFFAQTMSEEFGERTKTESLAESLKQVQSELFAFREEVTSLSNEKTRLTGELNAALKQSEKLRVAEEAVLAIQKTNEQLQQKMDETKSAFIVAEEKATALSARLETLHSGNREHDRQTEGNTEKMLRELREKEKCALQKIAVLERDLQEAEAVNAKLAGHTNTAQRIQYHVRIKTENERLKEEIKSLEQKIVVAHAEPTDPALYEQTHEREEELKKRLVGETLKRKRLHKRVFALCKRALQLVGKEDSLAMGSDLAATETLLAKLHSVCENHLKNNL